ncbi:Adenylate kinase [Corchorus capsularis]|uniref:UMP-CMP kinase n=1 Tax=Corchorus capsularis TaxID=210143 RepID=A0A1R3G3J9_COCAP|nr:Adenylate kinase [Corchorus capsularis]
MMNDLPTILKLLSEQAAASKDEEEGLEEEDEEEHGETLCGACGENYATYEFWICCDMCEKWFHGKCIITQARAEHIKQYKCPSCTNEKLNSLNRVIKAPFVSTFAQVIARCAVMETTTRDEQLQAPKELSENFSNERRIVYVLGGPGSGKGTQCSKIVQHFGFCHLNVGDLLQAEVESGSEYGKMIQDLKKEGKLVPSDVVGKLLQQAMERSNKKKFLIDGFPRNEENRVLAENVLKIEPDLVLFLDCSEGEMTRRLLNRNQGRVDDNIDTIKKRLKVYAESTLPVIDYYCTKGKVRKIDGEKSIDEVFQEVKGVLEELDKP